jgi:hypothetical protein
LKKSAIQNLRWIASLNPSALAGTSGCDRTNCSVEYSPD